MQNPDLVQWVAFIVLTVLTLVLLPADGSGALLDGVGAMGDSLTDEYEFSGLSAGRNWLEQLARSRGLNFGALSTTARAEPRRAPASTSRSRSARHSRQTPAVGFAPIGACSRAAMPEACPIRWATCPPCTGRSKLACWSWPAPSSAN